MSETHLRKAAATELQAFERQGQRRADADDAAFQMVLAYRQEGFAFAAVDYRIEPTPEKTILTFTASEGPRVFVDQIEISGNAALDRKDLLPFFEQNTPGLFGQGRLRFIKSDIAAAMTGIQNHYLSRGYRDVVIDAPLFSFSSDRTRATVTLHIREGVQYVVHDIVVLGDTLPEIGHFLDQSRRETIGQPYFSRKRWLLRSRLLELYGNAGYPDATVVVLEQPGSDPGMIVLEAQITPGPLVTVSGIRVTGNEKTAPGFIHSRILLKPGDRFNLGLQQKSFRNLYQTGLFSKIDLHLEKQATGSERPLVAAVTEVPARELYVEPGWGSYEQLRVKTGYRNKNLFGTGRIFGLDAAASLKAQGLTTYLSDPWFLGTDVKADLPVAYSRREEPVYTRRDMEGALLFSKKLTRRLQANGGYAFRMTDVSDIDPAAITADAPTDYAYGEVRAQITWDSRDDLFYPTRGQKSVIAVEHADTLLGSDITLTRLTGGVRWFIPLPHSVILGLRWRTGLIIPGSDDFNLPIAERFFTGGENTVRSFKQSELGPRDETGDPTGGLAFNVFNLELRRRLIGNLTGSVFLDCGNVSPNRTPAETGAPPYASRSDILSDTFDQYFKDFRTGVGFGLQYQLPIGPARIDFGFNPDRDRKREEDSFVVHFSVGMAF